jgi:hypothetical protein
MLDDFPTNDISLDASDIRKLENADEVAHFFARLGYDVDVRQKLPTQAIPYSNDLKIQILHHELIATDPIDEDIRIYLFQVRSVTAKLRNELARGFNNTSDTKVLLVLTSDYQQIEFVYLERTDLKKTNRKGLGYKVSIRPIPLTINRQNPDKVSLRALKRFTFTEDDADYQWAKLHSAYLISEWSEQYFNNRALFSDYYLKERLTNPKITPQWDDDVKPIGRIILKQLSTARKDYSSKPEMFIRQGMFEPIFKELGFTFKSQKKDVSSPTPDYLLYAPDKEQPIAAALTYVWNRNLDDMDETRETEDGTPKEIPGAVVVSLLEQQVAPWVIVTNGKLWRLYSSTASNKATNYYEIDLEEAITGEGQTMALKYWWLMFRMEAFTGFLDDLLKKSADYAKELGDRLKDDVFLKIFPQFAKGFIANMRAKGMRESAIILDDVFSGTMTFLYRLMFVLYAESLDLVPLNDVQGYRELSLYKLKQELKEIGGNVSDEAPEKLRQHYKSDSVAIYENLNKLFSVIDLGSAEWNMPTYNGGLFSQTSKNGYFLAHFAIPDEYLVLGLDRLTRDTDNRSQELVFIDFKSLGVRQLGSIYEGLLEFKLNIASEDLGVTKEKKKEVYQPVKKVKKPLAVISKGDVYLENDKRERKATGSYYTPDYIVKYIVKNTVGPVLDRKFEELSPRLRNAQKSYRDYSKLVEARRKSGGKDETSTTYWNNPDMQALVDDCLNIRVLDPAMGSGHFLVEVVDYISNRLIDYLNGWTDNPIWHFIDQTRQQILDDMERQGVTIDPERLTRVALLKRAVLKRCIYGVDLNAMAVELAKVSLWLDAFTLGAPLSFLDHHLKHGNSLIGAMDLEHVVIKGSIRWDRIMDAATQMVELSNRTDSTIGQVDQSKDDYEKARLQLEDIKKYANVPIASYFVEELIKYRKSKKATDRQTITQVAQIAYGTKGGSHDIQDIYDRAQAVADEKHFFHWKLEFPEIFIDIENKEWASDGGFDAVVGNPPYGRYGLLSNEVKDFIRDKNLAFGSADISEAFMSFILSISASNLIGMIVPKVFTYVVNWSGIRDQLKDTGVRFIADVSQAFPDVLYEQVIYGTGNSTIVKIGVVSEDRIIELHETKLQNFTSSLFPIYLNQNNYLLFNKVQLNTINLGQLYEYWYGKGGAVPQLTDIPTDFKVVQGRDIARYSENDNQIVYLTSKSLSDSEIDMASRRKIIIQDIVAHVTKPVPHIILMATLDTEKLLPLNTVTCVAEKEDVRYSLSYCLAILNSNFSSWYVYNFIFNCAIRTMHFMPGYVDRTPIPHINFTTPTDERERLTASIIGAYDLMDNAGMMKRVLDVLADDKTDVIHDVLAHFAQMMIDLNKSKQTEVKRFLVWLEDKLRIKPKNDGSTGIDSLTGKTFIQGYLGDYQKGEPETTWDDFWYRLHQNRNRFAVSLTDVEDQLKTAYEQSLATLIPIKQDLARTDGLIDKIVYRLYGLTDAEIELIERPQYEQALADAKANVISQDLDDDAKVEKIAEAILPVAQRYFDRVEPHQIEAILDQELPNWRDLPPDAPTFLLTGDYSLKTLPDTMDFSTSIVSYMKAVEVMMHERIFSPFRAQHHEEDVKDDLFKRFMRREVHLTLGSYKIIVPSSRERQLQRFMAKVVGDIEQVTMAFKDHEQVKLRNKAAHKDILTREEAQQVREWALGILRAV